MPEPVTAMLVVAGTSVTLAAVAKGLLIFGGVALAALAGIASSVDAPSGRLGVK